jgi:hypothetical protein
MGVGADETAQSIWQANAPALAMDSAITRRVTTQNVGVRAILRLDSYFALKLHETEAPAAFARPAGDDYNACGWPAGRVMARGLFEPM